MKKASPKKAVKRATPKKPMPVRIVPTESVYKAPKMPARASIEKADGGYIVSKGYGEKNHIAKDLPEAQKVLKKLLG